MKATIHGIVIEGEPKEIVEAIKALTTEVNGPEKRPRTLDELIRRVQEQNDLWLKSNQKESDLYWFLYQPQIPQGPTCNCAAYPCEHCK